MSYGIKNRLVHGVLWAWTVLAMMGVMAPAFAQTIVRYVHTDALGSPVAKTDATGAVVERSVYRPYGEEEQHGPADAPGFAGHVADVQTGLSYMQQRYYDPEVGLFLSVDPVSAFGDSDSGFNRYWYAFGNPYGFTDPDGRYACRNEAGSTCNETEQEVMVKYVGVMEEARDNMREGPAKDRLTKIVQAVGTANDGNGVILQFAHLKENTFGEQSGKTLRIDVDQISGYADGVAKRNGAPSADVLGMVVAGVIGHEGSHYLDDRDIGRGNAYPWSRAERELTEIRAYGVNSAMNKVMGLSTNLNSPGMTIKQRSAAIRANATSSVDAACEKGGGGCR